jgi:hypothetical protein
MAMDIAKVIQELHDELASLNAAIVSLERLQESTRRRGPTRLMQELADSGKGPVRRKAAAGSRVRSDARGPAI